MAAEISSAPPDESIPPPSMAHPSSPIGSTMAQDSHNPTSPPAEHRHPDSMGYRPPHPGAYAPPPPGYPHYSPYGAPPQSPYGGHPHGYPRGPPGSYPPPHHSPSFSYGYPPSHRPPYPYAYDGPYPGQQSRQTTPYRGASHPRQGAPTAQLGSQHLSPQKASPTGGKSSPRGSHESAVRTNLPNHVEVERLRAAAATELTHEEVKPIRSDFHFFVKAKADEYRKLAEEEVRKTTEGSELDLFLVNSNLNTRLMKAWEDLKKEERDIYVVKEEEDRRRFMEEDEIASRHCATLTARGKSPRSSEKGKKEERQESETKPLTMPSRDSPSEKDIKKSTSIEEEKKGDEEISVKVEEGVTVEVESTKKRLSPPTSSSVEGVREEEIHESPTKKGRVAEGSTS